MTSKLNTFLKKNTSIILTTVLFNAFFLIIFFVSYINITGSENIGIHTNQSFQTDSTVNVVAKSNPAVVSIIATADLPAISKEERRFLNLFMPNVTIPQNGTPEEVSGASGFFVSNDGLIVTNRHVVEDSSLEYTVLTSDGKSYTAKVLAKDPVYDVAILRIDESNTPYLTFGDSSKIELGQTVLAIGNALSELSNSVTKGIVSGLSRSVVAHGVQGQTEILENVIQTDAGINPGNSGGPLLSLKGEVVGVNVAVVQGSQNIGFSLPSNLVKSIVNSVKKNGKIIIPYLGVRYRVLSPDLVEPEGVSVRNGVLITRGGLNEPAIIPRSPAEHAGLKEGDIITRFNGVPINKENAFSRLVREAGVGERITLTILRAGKTMTVAVTLSEVPESLK